MPFSLFLLLNSPFQELGHWIILTGWASVALLLAVSAFFLLGISRIRRAWWQYLALLCIGGFGIWSLAVAYNSYQQLVHFYAQLPLHGFNSAFLYMRTPYLATLQTCQIYFTLTTGILVLLLGVTGWQLRRTSTKKAAYARLEDNRHRRLWISGFLLLIGICCLTLGVFLITKLDGPFYAPQDFQFEEPTTLELIGLYTVSLGGPLILLLQGITGIVRRSIVPR